MSQKLDDELPSFEGSKEEGLGEDAPLSRARARRQRRQEAESAEAAQSVEQAFPAETETAMQDLEVAEDATATDAAAGAASAADPASTAAADGGLAADEEAVPAAVDAVATDAPVVAVALDSEGSDTTAEDPTQKPAEPAAAEPVAARAATPPVPPSLLSNRHQAQRFHRIGWMVIGGALLPLALWMSFAPLSMAVVAPAYVKVDQNRRPVQHREGGIVRRVLVRDGQHVRAGDPLLELGDVSVDADNSRLGLRVHGEQATVARLEAERTLSRTLEFNAELQAAAAADPRVGEVLRKELALFDSRRDALLSESELLRSQRGHINNEIESLEAEVVQAESALAFQQRDLERSRDLVNDGFVSATRVGELEAAVADYSSRLQERRSEVARGQQRLVEAELKIKSIENDYVQFANDQLKTAIARLGELEQELRKADDASKRQVVTAPADGEVIDLKFTSAGAVVQPGEAIAEIVPSDAPLMIEARIRPEDINHVVQGQPARIKVLAFPFSSLVKGEVRYVSADRLVDPAQEFPYYSAMIVADAASLAETNEIKLQAGMPVEVYIEGTAQTTLQYVVEPITATLRRAGRPL